MEQKAKWIWIQESRPNQWVEMERKFDLEAQPQSAVAEIAVDSKYTLWVNGTLCVLDGGLNRGPECGKGYIDRISLARYLKQGGNTLRLMVWYWGNEGRNNEDSGHGGLYFQMEIDGETRLVSDHTWAARLCPGYQETGKPLPAYLYGGHNVGYDARKADEAASETWPKAVELGEMGCAPFGEAEPRPVPMMAFDQIRPFTKIQRQAGKWVCDLPYACQSQPYFKLRAPEGRMVDVRTDRYTVNGGPGDEMHQYNGHRVEYITRSGEQEFEAFNWMFGEKMIFTFDEGVELIEVGYRESGYDTRVMGSFHTGDDRINRLMYKCCRTLINCMRDNFMDCPDRERGQWIGDVSVQTPQVFYLLEQNAVMLMRKAISDFFRMRRGDVLVGNVPGVCYGELPPQSLCAVSEWGMLAQYYAFTGDKTALRQGFEPTVAYLKLWDMQRDGLVAPRTGNWRWFDHLEHIDEPVLENAWYYSTLKFARHMADELGVHDHDALLEGRMKSIAAAYDKAFWKGDRYQSGAYTDDRAQAMAALSGLASEDKYPALISVLERVQEATPYMEAFVLLAMCEMGGGKAAMARMMDRYGDLIDNENTTLWEDFHILGTHNHAWSGGPATCLMRCAAGIVPEGAGQYLIRPVDMGLKAFEAAMFTPWGKLSVRLENGIYFVKAPEALSLRFDERMAGGARIAVEMEAVQ